MTFKKRISMIQTKQAVTAAVEAALNVTLNADSTQHGPSQPKRRGRPPSQQQHNYQPSATTHNNRLNSVENKKNNAKTKKVDLEREVAELKAELRELKLIVESLKKNINNALPSKPNVVQNLKTTNMVVNDAKERERRSKNIIIRGIEPTNDDTKDEEAVKHFLNGVCKQPVAVKKVQRLFKKKNKDNKTEPTSSILVVLESKDDQEKALLSARHHNHDGFKNVFAHEDRTKAQQLEYIESVKQAKKKNEELERYDLLDKPFRWVVRGDRIRCIDAVKSRTDKKSVYVLESEINSARLDRASRRGHVNNTRQSMRQSNNETQSGGKQ